MSTIVEDSKNNNNMDIYEQHGLVKLVCMNSSIILLGMLCMALTLVALIWAMQLRTPIIFAMGSMAKEGGVVSLAPIHFSLVWMHGRVYAIVMASKASKLGMGND